MIKIYLFLLFILQVNIHSYDIHAVVETPQMPLSGDADDPAIWINKLNKSNSLVFGTDKYNGIYSYDLTGKIINYSKAGNVNNIDIRKTNVDGSIYSLLYGSNRSDSSLSLWILDDTKVDKDLKKGNFMLPTKPDHIAKTNMIVYGVCAGSHPDFGNIAFITEDKGSKVQMWAFNFLENNFTLLKEFNNSDATQSEGCVYDDENSTLFISEEQDRGILRAYKINKELEFNNPTIIDTRQGNIVGDPEGITILKISDKDGYVILSSQGNSKFNVYKRTNPYNFIKSFSIKGSGLIDEVDDTDGLDITNINLGADFPEGVLVVQDGRNKDTLLNNTQNFKYISTKDVLKKINLK